METHRLIRASVTGIDGSGKSSAVNGAIGLLQNERRIINPSECPVYSVIDSQQKFHYQVMINALYRMQGIADRAGIPQAVSSVKAVHVALQGRYIERRLIRKIHPDLVIGGRDMHIDPAVYAIFYSGRLGKKTVNERLNTMERIVGPHNRDIIVFLTVSPQEAMRRISNRLNEQRSGRGHDIHEDAKSLQQLQSEYGLALDVLQKRRSGLEIVEIDTQKFAQDEVAGMIAQKIQDVFSAKIS